MSLPGKVDSRLARLIVTLTRMHALFARLSACESLVTVRLYCFLPVGKRNVQKISYEDDRTRLAFFEGVPRAIDSLSDMHVLMVVRTMQGWLCLYRLSQ